MTHGIPSSAGSETVGRAAGVRPGRDVIKARNAGAVKPWVQEAQRALAFANPIVVQESDDTRKRLPVIAQSARCL